MPWIKLLHKLDEKPLPESSRDKYQIPDFSSVYHIVNDSIYGGELDSTTFFTGSTTSNFLAFKLVKFCNSFIFIFIPFASFRLKTS